MKIKVIKEFKDKECSGEVRTTGTILEREGARAKEIIDAGYAKEIKEVKAKTKTTKK